MNQKVLSLAVATSLMLPITATYADVKLSGTIQAEIASSEIGQDNTINNNKNYVDSSGEFDRYTLTGDKQSKDGAIFNGGPNRLRFDIDEKLGGGLTVQARYQVSFASSDNSGLTGGQESWVGLKTDSFFVRYGKLEGAYRASKGLIDVWAGTSLQARGTGGGMSGGYFNDVSTALDKTTNRYRVAPNAAGKAIINSGASTNHKGLAHSGYVPGTLEIGFKYDNFVGRIQGFVDDTSDMKGGGLIELTYSIPKTFDMWLAGAYTDLESKVSSATSDTTSEGLSNWKIGGQFKLGPNLALALQYEDAELGTFDNNTVVVEQVDAAGKSVFQARGDGGQYVMGSVEFTMEQFTLAGWVAGYFSDIDDNKRLIDINGQALDEDAVSFAIGGKYNFSKRTKVFAGYRQTNSDNDYRDENVITAGLSHSF
jgi:hypothetical protein